MSGPPVVLVPSGGIAATEAVNAPQFTVDPNGRGLALTLVASGGIPVNLQGASSPPDPIIPGVLTARAGVFNLTGVDMNTSSQYKMPLDASAFNLTGIAAGLSKTGALALAADPGSFSLTGAAATLSQGTGTFSPSSLSPSFWGEAASSNLFQSNAGTTAATANGDVVGYFADLSGNGRHFVSLANDGTRPTLQGVGAKKYLQFDGADDILTLAASLGSYAGGSASWFFTINQNNSAGNGTPVLAEGDSAATASVYSLATARSTDATSAAAIIRNSANTAFLTQATAVQANVFNNTPHVYGVVDNGSTLTPYLDGVAGTPVAYNRSGSLTQNRTGMGGYYRSSVGPYGAVQLYAALTVPRVLNSTEIANLSTYMAVLK